MDQSDREHVEAVLASAPADHEQLVKFWNEVLRYMYAIGYEHGSANKEVPHENRNL